MARISTRRLAQLLRRVGTSLHAGVDTRQVWSKEAEFGSPVHRSRLETIKERLDNGDTLAEAMQACQGYFPPLACDLVEVGESTGRLDEVLLGLADHYDHMLSLRRVFLISIAWPALELIGAIFIIGVLILVMGMISPNTKILGLGGTSGLMIYMWIILMVGGTTTILVMAINQGRLGSGPMRLAMRIPVLGNCLKTMGLARLAWSLGMTLDAGVDARRCMRLALRSTQNSVFMDQIDAVDQQLLDGHEFNEALASTRVFPEEFIQSLATAEISGTYGDSLQRLAEEYRGRAQVLSRTLTMVAGVLIWGMVGVLIVIVIFQMFFSLYLGPIQEALEY